MEHLQIEDHVEFSTAKRIRKKLIGSGKMVAELLCYEPGQSTPVHQHPQQDEIFYVLEGTGKLTVNGEERSITAKSLILVPARSQHGLVAGDTRLVILFFKAPATTTAA
ncbi:MAG: cupin domain-containing protein [Acidobacteria bacterium]|nr:cupin domain-containing protein [Acidobacteriota bacterium]